MATKPPVRTVSSDQFGKWWSHAPSADRLRDIAIDDPEMLGALFLADGARLRGWAAGAPALTDNFPRRISLASPRDEQDTAAFLAILNTPGAVSNFALSHAVGALWPSDLRARTDAAAFERQSRFDTILSLPIDDCPRYSRPSSATAVRILFSSKLCSGDMGSTSIRSEGCWTESRSSPVMTSRSIALGWR